MNLQRLGFALLGLILGILATFFTIKTAISSIPEPAFHVHADFAVYLNGERFDFSKDEYMSITPCKVTKAIPFIDVAYAHGEGEDIEVNSLKDALHLHDNDGNVVHVHQEGKTWHEFFESLEMSFDDTTFVDDQGNRYETTEEKGFMVFVNGEQVEVISQMEIRDLDRVLISYGDKNRTKEDVLSELVSVTNNACFFSESCPQRGVAPYESCGAGSVESFSDKLVIWLGL